MEEASTGLFASNTGLHDAFFTLSKNNVWI